MADNGKSVPLTQDAYDRLRAKLEFLEGEERQRIIEEIARARAHGDLSENAEYHAARERQGQQESVIREIRDKLENAVIIEADDDATVKPGKLVTIRYASEDETETYFVGEREEEVEHDVLTPQSPLGQALLGRAAGDSVTARVPSGDLAVEIVEVRAR